MKKVYLQIQIFILVQKKCKNTILMTKSIENLFRQNYLLEVIFYFYYLKSYSNTSFPGVITT